MRIEDWGLVPYVTAYERQKALVNEVIAGDEERLVFCEHPVVLTLGRMTKSDNLLFTPQMLAKQGVAAIAIDRGGDVTLHAPGQMVVYPIMHLGKRGKDLKKYMQALEHSCVDLLADFGILAESLPGKRGVFVKGRKLVSIGVGVRKWVTYHGLGINVATDLDLFRMIRPCGLDVMMTSMEKELGRGVDMDTVKARMAGTLAKHLVYADGDQR